VCDPKFDAFRDAVRAAGHVVGRFSVVLARALKVNADGDIVAPSKPGLGVEPDVDKLARYRVSV